MKIFIGLVVSYLLIIGVVVSSSVVEAVTLNDYGRIPNKVATSHHANGGPARNNPHGYLYRER